jgi:ubiquinone/menaquinone biosynthesis C-methylase UbiE
LPNGPAAKKLFDDWPDAYDRWFTTPIGKAVRQVEGELLLELLRPEPGEFLLDAGCGTGIFTLDLLSLGSRVVGLDISLPMLIRAGQKSWPQPFPRIAGDLLDLPFPGSVFDKSVSVTALEFIAEGGRAIAELFRVTKPGGRIVVATLNSRSPWASRREAEARKGSSIFSSAVFRSPAELAALAPVEGVIRTAVHFGKEEDPDQALRIEKEEKAKNPQTGALLVACWQKR